MEHNAGVKKNCNGTITQKFGAAQNPGAERAKAFRPNFLGQTYSPGIKKDIAALLTAHRLVSVWVMNDGVWRI